MPRARTGSIFKRKGYLYARITYMGTDGKRHAVWRSAKNRTHAKQLLVEIAQMLGTRGQADHQRARRKHGFIYALRMESPEIAKPIKIGFSIKVESRVESLACGSPYPITLIGFWETGNGDMEEREVHKAFAADRLQGEWFRPSPALMTVIAERVSNYQAKLTERTRQLENCKR